jgi:integrase
MAKRSNGEGTVMKRTLKRKDGTTYVRWVARVTVGFDGVKQSFRYGPKRKTQAEAKVDLRGLQAELAAGVLTDAPAQTVAQYLEAWLKSISQTKKYRTYDAYESSLRVHVIPRIGRKRLDKLTKADVQTMCNTIYRSAREQGHKGEATTRKARAALRAALQDAVNLDILVKNACVGVSVPSEQVSKPQLWTKEEAAHFLEVAREHRIYPIIYTALTTGMREMELCGLMWKDLELVNEAGDTWLRINIARSLLYVTKKHDELARLKGLAHLTGRFYTDTPKTKGSQDGLAVGADTLELLSAHRVAQEARAKELGARWHDFGLVFPASNGAPQSPHNLLRDYKMLIQKAGVPSIVFHELRDTHASRLIAEGVDVTVVSERLRHSRVSTTLDKYAHVIKAKRKAGAVTLAELFKS